MGKYDFSGWATRANLKCSDGRIIMPNAFKEDDGRTVPLVWNHNHNDPSDVIGHALLENRGDGVYAYCTFNDSENGKLGKILVEHGDVNALSICANKLKQVGSQVMHGVIREVSLVLAGANPGAFIENVMEHGEEIEDQAIIMTGEEISLYHAEEENEEMNSSTENNNNKTIKDVFDEMTEEQQKVVYAIVGQAVEDASDTSEDDEEDDNSTGGSDSMKQNVFDTQDKDQMEGVLMHSDGTPVTIDEVTEIFKDAKRYGSLKDSCLQHGIDDVEYLFPDDRNITTTPTFISRDM